MLLEPTLFLHGVNLVTGPGSGSGKTTFAKAAALSVHCAGHTLALVSVGLEGIEGLRQGRQNAAGRTSGPPREALKTEGQSKMSADAGDVFVTAEAYLGSSHCMPEVLDLVPGSSAVGRLVIARARRSGNIALAGPECNEHLAWIVRRIKEEGWADTIMIDGALNRITQAAFLPGARLFYAVRADRSNYIAMTRKMRYLLHLAELPQYTEGEVFHVAGPLTQYVL
ncbi:MAG: hypothetical protein LLF89_09140, partial [Spirochaetaceae bacterium]|nr:hypothetical protein [Spirochaetaceae bacterium]